MRILHLALLTLLVSALVPVAVHAETVDEIITLNQKNVGEDVLVATVNNSKSEFNLSAQDIIKLKNANVPNSVITAMLKHHGASVAAAPAPAPAPWPPANAPAPAAAAPDVAAAPPPAAPLEAGEGTLDLENLDNRAWSYRFEPAVGTIWIVPAERSGRIAPNGNLSLRMKTGVYAIRYSGSPEKGATVTVYNGRKSQVLVSRVNTDQLEALYVSVFENGEKKAGARLAVLRDGSVASAAPDTHVTVPSTEYVTPAPQTTVIYREPVYVAPPPLVYAPGYYYRPYYYYPRNTVNFGYYHGGSHSRVGVGLGFGF